MRRSRLFKATNAVLVLLSAMYFITYVMRQSIANAFIAIQPEFHLSNTALGFIFSAFAYPYLAFQIGGGLFADRLGARRTLVLSGVIWSGATVLTALANGYGALFFWRMLMGLGLGATLPTATAAMQNWVEVRKRGFAQGIAHSFSRLGTALTPVLVVALMHTVGWRGSFVVIGAAGFLWVMLWGWYFRDDPKDHFAIMQSELAVLAPLQRASRPAVPWLKLVKRLWPVALTYFCYGWCLWLYLSFLPLFFKETFSLSNDAAALLATIAYFVGAIGNTIGGVVSDRLLHKTGNVRFARLSVILFAFAGALLWLLPVAYVHNLGIVAVCLSGGFFFVEMVIGPIWAIPMDIAPQFSGTASGLMNTGSALAAIVSPLAAGYITDLTHDRKLPFVLSIVILLIGFFSAFFMHPERRFGENA